MQISEFLVPMESSEREVDEFFTSFMMEGLNFILSKVFEENSHFNQV